MDRAYYLELAKARLERAKELLEDARELFVRESYKSANNRAFYAMEKSIKALLATAEMEVSTHNGGLKQFNYIFIHKGDGSFTIEDYQKIAKAEQIRNVSDYDDFYIKSSAYVALADVMYLGMKFPWMAILGSMGQVRKRTFGALYCRPDR